MDDIGIPSFDDLNLSSEFRLNVIPRTELDDFGTKTDPDYKTVRDRVQETLSKKFAVLGIDIYKYSEFAVLEQALIPRLFSEIYNQTCSLVVQNFQYLFQKYTSREFSFLTCTAGKYFIGTGDGGYQIFQTPLHSIIFASVFEAVVRQYNTRHFMTKVFDLVGPITLRYAVTLNSIYSDGSSFYGKAIIDNARILSKDKLNRLLVDENTFHWFQLTCFGIENLTSLSLADVSQMSEFQSYDSKYMTEEKNELIYLDKEKIRSEGIKLVVAQKLGPLIAKSSRIQVYNVGMQVRSKFGMFLQTRTIEFTYSLGNLNAGGIVEA